MEFDGIDFGGSLAIGLYIIFFASNPPYLVRMALANPVLLALIVFGCAYVTMYISNPVGILMLLAVLISMTSVTEYLTNTSGNDKQSDLLDGDIYKCKGTDNIIAVVRDGKLTIIPSVEEAASYIDNLKTYVREIDCSMVGSSEERPSSNNKCTIPPHQQGYDRPGKKIDLIQDIPDVKSCALECCKNKQCGSYSYFSSTRQCQLYVDKTFTIESSADAYTGVVEKYETSQETTNSNTDRRTSEMTAPDSEPRTAPMTVRNVQQVSESFETLTSHSRENPSLIDATASNVENFTPF
jgi:hypothetical protein